MTTAIELDKQEIKELYTKKLWSAPRIAREFGVSCTPILRILREVGIIDFEPYRRLFIANSHSYQEATRKATKLKPNSNIFTLSQAEIGYIAGFLDGEGNISLSMSKPKKRNGYIQLRPVVAFSNTNREVIDWLSSIFGNSTIYLHGGKRGNEKNVWATRISNLRDILAVLELLLPYLKIKKRQAVLLSGYCKSRLEAIIEGKRLSSKDYNVAEKLKVLNRRGKWPEPVFHQQA